MTQRISLNVIVFNEEARLEACLSDARAHVDEIVVVDQMSTDGTSEIARRLADVYVRDSHHGHAEPSRQLAASRSSGDWLLILDADETMSALLKAELRSLVEGDADGYWIRKENVVGGTDFSTVLHYRLCRKTRVRFDSTPHGGAVAVSDNFGQFDEIGIVHEKSVAEQVFDDARYERMALEDDAPTSAKRSWLSHNRTLRAERERARRLDLEALVPADVSSVLVIGDLPIELPGCALTRAGDCDPSSFTAEDGFDAAILAPSGDDPMTAVRAVADLVRPGGVIVATAPAARNRRRIEAFIGGVLGDHAAPETTAAGESTRRRLLDELSAAGLDARWMSLVRDGWLDPLRLQPDGAGTVVESDEFLLRSVPADVSEELTAAEIVFAAVRRDETHPPECSVVVVALAGEDPRRFADALRETAPQNDYELVVVQPRLGGTPIADATSVSVDDTAGLAARWNAGARAARGRLLVFASADAVPLPGWLDALVQAHRSRPDTGAVGSKVIAGDDTIEHAGLVLGDDRIPYRIYQGAAATAPHVNRHRIMPAVAAEGMITSRAHFVEVGGFDETLGDELADADLCLRLRARGLPIVYSPAAVIRAPLRLIPGTAGAFRRSAREFVARWSPTTFRSDDVMVRSDGCDADAEGNRSWRLPRPAAPSLGGLPAIAWTGHFLEGGGYTEEAIAAVEALDAAGLRVVVNPVTWKPPDTPLPAGRAARLAALMERDLPDDFVHVAHIGANRFRRHPAALGNVGRTMYETDGLPVDWCDRCNTMDEIWVPSEHNLHTFANAGVAVSKLHKVPETFDNELFHPGVSPLEVDGLQGFVFLSVFSWIARKGWHVLLRAWCDEFGADDDVTLLLKADTAISPRGTNCAREVEAFVRNRLKRDPRKGPPIVVLDQPLEVTDVPRLYRAADAFVLASRGEGWGRPQMEAMAMGLPTIATGWSGNLEFMNEGNSYLVDYKLVDAPAGPWTGGQLWADPSVRDLRRAMRRVYDHRVEAAATGTRARADVLVSCRPELVVEAVRERLEAIACRPGRVSRAVAPRAPLAPRRKVKSRRRISACVVAHDAAPSLTTCLSSLEAAVDEIVVVDIGSGEDMASVRNDALERATGGWVLMVDATCTLDPASVELLRQLVKRDRFVGYTARELRQFGLDGAVSAIERRTAALFPRHPDLRYVGRVAEQLLPRRADLDFRLVSSPVILRQHDNRAGRLGPAATARRDLKLLDRSVRDEPREPFHLYNLAAALDRLGLHDQAEVALREAIAQAPAQAIWAPSAHASLARAVAAQGRTAEAVKSCKTATRLAPEWPEGWCVLGAALVAAGREQAALRAYARALRCTTDSWLASEVPNDTTRQVRAGIGRIHLMRREFREAADCLRGAVAQTPADTALLTLLARAEEALGRSAEAGDHVRQAIMVPRAGPEAAAAFADFFTGKAEAALLRGLADNAESRVLLERIERLRAARAIT